MHQIFIYLLAASDDNKVHIKILDATLFITQVELKPLFLLKLMFWELNAKHIILLHILKLKMYCEFWGSAGLYR